MRTRARRSLETRSAREAPLATTGRTQTEGEPPNEASSLEAFNRLVLEHQHTVYSVAYRYLGSREAAEDATQEAFLKAYRAFGQFRGEHSRAWLMRIVANTASDELRRRKMRPQQSLNGRRSLFDAPAFDPPDAGPTPESVVLNDELRRDLESALCGLPDDWRMVVLLADLHGFSYAETAQATALPLGTVKSRLSRARRQLRDVLRPSDSFASVVGDRLDRGVKDCATGTRQNRRDPG